MAEIKRLKHEVNHLEGWRDDTESECDYITEIYRDLLQQHIELVAIHKRKEDTLTFRLEKLKDIIENTSPTMRELLDMLEMWGTK